MPQKQRHRGKHPEDSRLFGERWLPALRDAVADLSFLLSRRYAEKAAQKLVGDHYQLHLRQRRAVLGASCSDVSLDYRERHRIAAEDLGGSPVSIDGYNLLITAESALSDGVLVRGRDGCVRDLASVHGSYHRVEETLPAVRLIGETLARLGVVCARWYLDAPVSNSGRLKALLLEEAAAAGWQWEVKLSSNTDKALALSEDVVVTADSWILDRVGRWARGGDEVAAEAGAKDRVIDLGTHMRG